jgi:hypothetical protein
MAIFELPARITIEIPDEEDVHTARRMFLTTMAQEYLKLRHSFVVPNLDKKREKDLIVNIEILDKVA